MNKQSGFGSPILYGVGLLVVLLGLVSTYAYTLRLEIKAEKANHALFVGQVTAMTSIIQKDIEVKENERARITSDLTEKNEKIKTDLDTAYDKYERMRHDKERAGSSRVSSLSDAAKIIDCPDSEAGLDKALELLESGVLRDLAKPRDEAVNRNQLSKEWLDKQMGVD